MLLKQTIHTQYLQLVQDKIDVFQDMISGLTEDSKNDAKGSAGDKHETALSMMHLEQEKLTQKLREAMEQKAILDKIDVTQQHQIIGIGTLVQTNKLTVFVSCALPKITVNQQTIFGISPFSPLGEMIMGKTKGYSFAINGVPYTIEDLY